MSLGNNYTFLFKFIVIGDTGINKISKPKSILQAKISFYLS